MFYILLDKNLTLDKGKDIQLGIYFNTLKWNRNLFLTVLFLFFTYLSYSQTDKSSNILSEEKLIWSDEFEGTGIPDPNKWDRPEYNRKNNANGPDGWWSKEDSYLDGNGNLVIRIRKIANKNSDNDAYDYSVGAIRTRGKFEIAYGKFEIRCKLPTQKGWWVAFWMMQGNVGSVENGGIDGSEVDIMEAFGWTDRINQAIHWDGYGTEHRVVGTQKYPSGIRDGFHTYTLEWYPEIYIFYIDGKETWRTKGGGICNQKGYLKVTGEISTADGFIREYWANDPKNAQYPDSFIVDYVRVYDLPKLQTKYTTEYVSICDGSSYNYWTVTGHYQRILTTALGADSIVTTFLTVNPIYSITENITIRSGDNYNSWTQAAQYSRTLSSVSGCDSIIVTNLTVTDPIIKQGDLIPTHYIPVWQGQNGLNHMNLKVVSANLEDLPLNANDEVAVFDGSICVGSSKLAFSIDPTNSNTFLTIAASKNDGSGNGFNENDTILFKIWDNKNKREMVAQTVTFRNDLPAWLTSGKFASGLTSVVQIVSYTEYKQTINLVKGYNLMSTYVALENPSISTLAQPLINEGSLIKIQDESGNSFENWGSFGGWINKVGNIETTEGYKIKVANNCILQITGRPVALPLEISLKTGWNMISFPRTDLIDAMNIIQPLIDRNILVKVQDELGNSIENWGIFGGWKNGIGNFIPGKAYGVKLTGNSILTIQKNYTKASVIITKTKKTEHFSTDMIGNGSDHMNINLVGLREAGVSAGDELAVFDGKICVGAVKITETDFTNNAKSIPVSASEQIGTIGFKEGNPIELRVWKNITNLESKILPELIEGELIFNKQASVFVKMTDQKSTGINEFEYLKIEIFPNPARDKVYLRYSRMPKIGTRISLSDLSGKQLLNHEVQSMHEVLDIQSYPPGLYLVKMASRDNYTVNKLIIN